MAGGGALSVTVLYEKAGDWVSKAQRAGKLSGSAALLSSLETNLASNPSPLALRGRAEELPLAAYLRGDLRPLLLWGLLVVLLCEAYAFHRLGLF